MTQTTWAKGPYRHDGQTIYALNETGTNRFSARIESGYEYQARQPRDSIRTSQAELEAVAALFAAAPKMYEALERITDCFGVGWKDPAKFVEAVSDFMVEGRAALAAARGEAPTEETTS